MSNTPYYVPELKRAGAWLDWRGDYKGGFNFVGRPGPRPLSAIRYPVIHHTVTQQLQNARKEVDLVAYIHLEKNGWGGIGYNFIVTSEEVDYNGTKYAKVAYVGDIAQVRAHTPNFKGSFGIPARQGNYYLLGIAIIGAFHQSARPTEAQLNSAHLLLEELLFKDSKTFLTGLADASWNGMKEHKDFDSTACAGHFEDYKKDIINPPMDQGQEDPCAEYEARILELEAELVQTRNNYDKLQIEYTELQRQLDECEEQGGFQEPGSVVGWITAFVKWLSTRPNFINQSRETNKANPQGNSSTERVSDEGKTTQ